MQLKNKIKTQIFPKPILKRLLIISPFILAAILLYFALKNIDWNQVTQSFLHITPVFLAVCVVISTISLGFRGFRWRVLLASQNPPSAQVMFGVTSIGYLGNLLLPARAGELIRSYLLGKLSDTSVSFILATAVVERAVDALILVLLAISLTMAMFGLPGWLLNAIIITGVAGVMILVIFASMKQLEPMFHKILRKLPLPTIIQEKIIGMVSQFITGCQALKNPLIMAKFLLYSILIWLADAANTSILAYSFGFNINIGQSLLYLSALGLSSAIPSTPGYVGVYQFVAVNLLPFFGLTPSQALSFVLFAQCLSLIIIMFWGLISLIGFNINPKQLLAEATSQSKPTIG